MPGCSCVPASTDQPSKRSASERVADSDGIKAALGPTHRLSQRFIFGFDLRSRQCVANAHQVPAPAARRRSHAGRRGADTPSRTTDVAPRDKTDDPAIRMKSNPEPSTREVLAGLVERVTFDNAENGFCVLRAKARGHRDLVTVGNRDC